MCVCLHMVCFKNYSHGLCKTEASKKKKENIINDGQGLFSIPSGNGQSIRATEQINNVKGHPGDGLTTSMNLKLFRLAQRNEM